MFLQDRSLCTTLACVWAVLAEQAPANGAALVEAGADGALAVVLEPAAAAAEKSPTPGVPDSSRADVLQLRV